jgi:endo-alpha-1,4-polygalactosaminidase (GH114 family)
MSVGEAETCRHYWRAEWTNDPPSWMDEPNADW